MSTLAVDRLGSLAPELVDHRWSGVESYAVDMPQSDNIFRIRGLMNFWIQVVW